MVDKLRILHLSSELTWRGGEQQIAYLVKGSEDVGIDAQVICRKDSKMSQWCSDNQIPYFEINFLSAYNIKDSLKVKDIFKKNRFDILHLHSSKSHTMSVISGVLGLKAKMILSRRVDVPVKKNLLSRYKYNYSQIHKIVCVSNAIKALSRPSIIDSSKLLTIYSTIDTKRFLTRKNISLKKLTNAPESAKLIGNTSALTDQKDYPTFIQTANEILKIDPNFHFVIFGVGELKQRLIAMISSYHLESNFSLMGFSNELNEYLPQLDYFLFTSKNEGLGTSILDAYAAGVPVISTCVGGIPEIVKDNETGLLRGVGDFKGLANAILSIDKDPVRKQGLTDNAFDFVQHFSIDKYIEAYARLYKEVKSL